jgi:flotillin
VIGMPLLLAAKDGMEVFFAVVAGSVAVLVGVLAMIWIVKQFLFICRPNELLVFSGRANNKSGLGYRMISSATGKGRGFRVPFLETVQRIDLSLMEVEVSTRSAFCRGGVRLNVDAIANVKISSSDKIVRNAIERFLGQDRHEVMEVAKNTLEGHLRAVLATLTPEEVNEDRLKFAMNLGTEAERDLNKLGLHLDTFNIHSVSDIDNSSYLAEIGRKSIAEVLKNAEVFEADCERAAAESEADCKARADVAAEQAETIIRVRANEMDEEIAKLTAAARSAEEAAEAARETARAVAELELQQVRSELEGKRLHAEVVVKAQAETRAKEYQARAQAAPIIERGKALAGSLDLVRTAWAEAGDGAKPIFLIQQLDMILRQVVSRVGNIRVNTVNLVDQGDGSSLPAYVASYPATVSAILRELDGVTGIDIVGSLGSAINQNDANTGGA